MKLPGHVARMREIVGKLEGDRPLGRSRRRRNDNIRMNARETVETCALDASG
jgi:hypothetical protein